MNKAPEGAMIRVFGSYYKIGIHGKVFRFDDDEWKLSSRSRKSIEDSIDDLAIAPAEVQMSAANGVDSPDVGLNVARDKDGIAHIVPVSGGKDSACLALALKEKEPRPYTYVYTPTGDELPEMVAHLKRLEKLLGQEIIHLSNGTLATQIEANNMLPNVFARWCTRLLKLRPAGQFYEQHAPVVCYVGIRDDEDQREGTRPGGDSAAIGTDVVQTFPFQRWGWDLDAVWSFLDDRGITIPDRTDCARCPYQKLGEWYNLWAQHSDIYRDAEADEERWGHTYRSPGRDTWPAGLRELRELFEAGKIPERSLRMMEKRRGMCRACSM